MQPASASEVVGQHNKIGDFTFEVAIAITFSKGCES